MTGLVLFWVINSNIGFMKPASSVLHIGIGSDLYISSDDNYRFSGDSIDTRTFYALSLPIALVALVILFLMYIFYFRFTPKKHGCVDFWTCV